MKIKHFTMSAVAIFIIGLATDYAKTSAVSQNQLTEDEIQKILLTKHLSIALSTPTKMRMFKF